MKSRIGKTSIVILALIPFIIWLIMMPIGQRFSDADTTYTSIGQVAGLVGMVMFALSLILSGRFSFLEKYFGGLNNMYKVHHEFGGYSLILLVLHPLSLAIAYGYTSLLGAILFILPSSNDWARNMGSISFILLFILLFITFYTKLPYQIWKWTHKFLGLSFFLGGLHALFIGSDIARNPFLKYYLIILCSVAIIVYFYRTVLFKFTVKKHKFTVENITNTNDIFQISLRPKKKNCNLKQDNLSLFLLNKEAFRVNHILSLSFRLKMKTFSDLESKLLEISQKNLIISK